MKGLNIRIIVMVFLVTLGVALLAKAIYYQKHVVDNLLVRLTDVSGIAKATFDTQGDKQIVVVLLSDGADLHTTYTVATQLSQQSLGSVFGGVRIMDNRDTSLSESYYRMHFFVQQGIMTGLFTDMMTGIDAIAKQDHIDNHKVFVDGFNIYVQMTRGHHHLYEVIPRGQTITQELEQRRGVTTW